ncbi:MAG: gamma-glutamyltransferase [Iamia sp.]
MGVTTTPGPSGALVAAGHPATAAAAGEVLAAGGNAFDAVVGAGFTSAVAEPGLTSLAGGGFCLARTEAGEELLVDFFVDTPGRGRASTAAPSFEEVVVDFEAATQAFHCGPGSIAVPGCLPGYLHLHRRLGRLDLAQVVQPAARRAAKGVALLPRQAGIIALLEPILTRTAAGRALFAPHDGLLRAGDTFRNPDLASFLSDLGRGDDLAFSRGTLGAALLAVTADDGLLTAADLAAYAVVERTPLEVAWRTRRVLTNPAPSFGGTLIAAALRRLDHGTPVPGDPAAPAVLAAAAAEVDRHRSEILAGDDPLASSRRRSSRGTTHISVWDGEGGAAAMTTSNGECSGDVIEGTGILTNNILGEDDLHPDGFLASPPGLRVASMMSPTVVVGPDGDTELVVGSGGSKRIRAAITQVLVNVVVHGLDPAGAVEAARVHWDVDRIEVEPGLDAAALAALAQLGPVNTWPERSVFFGGAHLVVPGVGAAGDLRRDGAALAP